MVVLVIILLLLIILGIIARFNVRFVEKSQAVVISMMGSYWKTWEEGFNWKFPIICRVVKEVNLKVITSDYPPQAVTTKDNINIEIDSVVYHKVADPYKYTYYSENPDKALELLCGSTLRNEIAGMTMAEAMRSREQLNRSLLVDLNRETQDQMGIEVTQVVLKSINPPPELMHQMEKVVKAQQEKEAEIELAEGEAKSTLMRAEAAKKAAVLKKEAEAEGIRILRQAGLSSEQIVRLQSLEALQKVSEGNATKIIIPSDMQNLTSLVTSIKESAQDSNISGVQNYAAEQGNDSRRRRTDSFNSSSHRETGRTDSIYREPDRGEPGYSDQRKTDQNIDMQNKKGLDIPYWIN